MKQDNSTATANEVKQHFDQYENELNQFDSVLVEDNPETLDFQGTITSFKGNHAIVQDMDGDSYTIETKYLTSNEI